MNESISSYRIFFIAAAMTASIYAFATQDHNYQYRSPEPMPAHMLKTSFNR